MGDPDATGGIGHLRAWLKDSSGSLKQGNRYTLQFQFASYDNANERVENNTQEVKVVYSVKSGKPEVLTVHQENNKFTRFLNKESEVFEVMLEALKPGRVVVHFSFYEEVSLVLMEEYEVYLVVEE